MIAGGILIWKLPLVRIPRVAVCTFDVGDWFFEVAVLMAPETLDPNVSPAQGKLRSAVVKAGCHAHLFPSRRAVTALAGSLKRAVVRILVAVIATGKRKILVLYIGFASLRQLTMATIACYLFVQSGKRVMNGGMIKSGCRLPALKSMAARAVGVELSPVFVGVASGTNRRQAEIGVIQVFDPDHFAP